MAETQWFLPHRDPIESYGTYNFEQLYIICGDIICIDVHTHTYTPTQNLYNRSIYLPPVLVRIYLLSILSILCILHYSIYSTYSIQSILSLPIACTILSYVSLSYLITCYLIWSSLVSADLILSYLFISIKHDIISSLHSIIITNKCILLEKPMCFSSCPKEQCHWTVIPQRSAGGLARAGAAEVRAVELLHFGAIISQGVQGSRPTWTTDVIFLAPKVDPIGARPQQK